MMADSGYDDYADDGDDPNAVPSPSAERHHMQAVADAQALARRLRAILWEEPDRFGVGDHGPHFVSITLNIPTEWLVLAAWLDTRDDHKCRNLDDAFQDMIDALPIGQQRKWAKRALFVQLQTWFHHDLNLLEAGLHPLLERPPPPHDYDSDGIPF